MAGLDEVPVVIKNVDELTAAEMTMVENLQREDLNPIEEAMGYKYLIDNYSLTQEEISKKVAKSRAVIANALRILSLPEDVLNFVADGEISAGHARAILAIDEPEEQYKLADRVIKNGLSVRETEKIVRARKNSSLSGDIDINGEENENKTTDKELEKLKKETELYLKDLQNRLSGIFGKKVVINMTNKDGSQSGKLEIEYKNSDELESIIKVLCGGNDIFES